MRICLRGVLEGSDVCGFLIRGGSYRYFHRLLRKLKKILDFNNL